MTAQNLLQWKEIRNVSLDWILWNLLMDCLSGINEPMKPPTNQRTVHGSTMDQMFALLLLQLLLNAFHHTFGIEVPIFR